MVWDGVVWCGVGWCGVGWDGVGCGVGWCGVGWCGVVGWGGVGWGGVICAVSRNAYTSHSRWVLHLNISNLACNMISVTVQ